MKRITVGSILSSGFWPYPQILEFCVKQKISFIYDMKQNKILFKPKYVLQTDFQSIV
jgi:hypothetical protein